MQKHKIIIKKKNALTNENADDTIVLENNKRQRRTEREYGARLEKKLLIIGLVIAIIVYALRILDVYIKRKK